MINVEKILSQMIGEASRLIGEDFRRLRGYSERKLRFIARASVLLATAVADGEMDSREEIEEYLDEIDNMIRRFIRNVVGLTRTMIERVFRMLSSIVVGAVNAVAPEPFRILMLN